MRKSILASLLAVSVLLIGAAAQADYVLFDDIATPGGWGNVPANYQGYQWSGFQVASQGAYNALLSTITPTNITFPSQPNAVYNGDNANVSVTMTSATQYPFVFNGAEFWAWAPGATMSDRGAAYGGYTPSYLTVTGWLGGVQVGSEQIIDFWDTLKGFGGTPYAYLTGLGWLVDTVKFELDTTGGNQGNTGYWSMDCVNVATTPVPPSLYLLAAGLVGTLVARRRSKVRI